MMKFLMSFLLIIYLVNRTSSVKILGIFNFPSYSHFILGEALFKELAKQGHEVTMVSPYAQKTPVKNYRDIVLTDSAEKHRGKEDDRDFLSFSRIPYMVKLAVVSHLAYQATEVAFSHKNLQALITSEETFDLIIIEAFLNEAFYGFGYKFKAPVISLSTGGATPWVNRFVANPSPSSYIVDVMQSYTPQMTLIQRLNNFVASLTHDVIFNLYTIPKHNALMHQYFPDAPHLNDLVYNTSFILLNSHPAQSAPVPLTPNMKEIGGFHIKEDVKLPEEIKQFLDDSKEGVIYFALGSNFKSSMLPREKLEAILNGFKKWKKPVLWKFEDESLPAKASNIKIAKWLPQTAVLAHPNVKAFISHGGKLSVMEATYFGVPIIGIPIFAEQPYNVRQIEYAGNGFMLEFASITEDVWYNSLIEITSNPKYSQEAKLRSQAMKSGKMTPMEEAIYWIEYVLKFKGADHLKNYGVHLLWYQRYMIDVFVLVGVVMFGINWLLCKCYKKVSNKICVMKKMCKEGKVKKN